MAGRAVVSEGYPNQLSGTDSFCTHVKNAQVDVFEVRHSRVHNLEGRNLREHVLKKCVEHT